MGQEKHQRDVAESNWDRKAEAEDIRCSDCKMHITLGEVDVYRRTKMRGACAKRAEKDD
ncbi:hypothetical protein SAMN04489798_2531 [Pseudomonas arsenicoxydans]|uniref:Uncharacterized protein n=1 Tax=Pseudomonas arsenicoxydans TaxID=702115 RepID=A0A1H0I8N7_9PSED|nr:hypothetical protein SAMN04489798_2531 [Pseudomonas arsenicoxydans]